MDINETGGQGRCCKRCRFYDPTHRPQAACHALGLPVPWGQMIETDCKGEGAPLWQPIEGPLDDPGGAARTARRPLTTPPHASR